MTNYKLMDLLGRAFAYGEIDTLAAYLAPNCDYVSEYANRRVKTAGKTIDCMKQVHSNVTEECRYTSEPA